MPFLGGVTSDFLGLPQGSFEKWLNAGPYLIDVEVPTPKPKAIKNPEIPVLKEITLKKIVLIVFIHNFYCLQKIKTTFVYF